MHLSDFKHSVTYSTKLRADVIYSRLLSVTAPYTTFTSYINLEHHNKKYQGDIANEGFVLICKGSRTVAWAPEIKGRFEFGDTQSLIHLRLSPHPIGIVAVLISLAILLPVSVSSIKSEMQKPVFDPGIFWILAFTILFPLVAVTSYLYNTYTMKIYLKELLEAQEL